MKNRKSNILVCTLIGLCFLWTGSGYLTWMYRLLDFYPAASVDILTEVIGYIFQVLGLIGFSLYIKKRQEKLCTPYTLTFFMVTDLIFMILSVLSTNGACTLLFGYLMNLFHGFIAGIYLTELSTRVFQQNRGIIFGLGYGLGSVGSWIISRIGDSNFLKSNYVLIMYAFLVFLSLLIACILIREPNYETDSPASSYSIQNHVILLAGITVFMLSGIRSAGFYFPLADLANASINMELSRAFYAIGLIIAGMINDKNRKWGAVCCIAALVFPFAMFVLQDNMGSSFILWVVSYIFFGFFAVYRVIIFADIAGKSTKYLYLAGLGLMFGRCGDAVGSFAGSILGNYTVILVLCTSSAFMVTVFLFIQLYNKIYLPITSEAKNKSAVLENFIKLYQISPREIEVFQLIIEGHSNKEIADSLFISENTVKFHIKNLLKKTECSNRIELVALFKEY